ncbi:BrnT family toxin [Nitratireductor aquimarinus]|uniref:BrnT family toxin n=2 Tax=Pseudomonadota TaxID=1224 RepID=A0ABU4AGZ5_9HYPH|nr:BrnT family toxin [Nitratireductor aquimarinus]MDV6225510.1 BrnT family toxin [Nitratireductor aquimarinus]
MKIAGFDWDTGNWPKCAKHGVSKDEIEHALLHDPLIAPDPAHSGPEDRYIVIGRNRQGRPMFMGVTFRMVDGKRLIRPITARYMHAKEVKRYETQRSQTENR